MKVLYLVVVIPCFNEEQTLVPTCASLGFGIGFDFTPVNTFLVLVNNNSTDATVALAERIALSSLPGRVIIGHEPVQGYVPPRHRGNLLAQELAQARHWPLEHVLLLQADADTCYTAGYGESMRATALASELNCLLEASVAHGSDFQTSHPLYADLCDVADDRFKRLFPQKLSDEVVVDDKITGYRLSDYFRWGGHQREFTAEGEEIHAETTRLYIRARAMGAIKIAVPQAIALHSARKIITEPALHLATAGFPREDSWNCYWRSTNVIWSMADLAAHRCKAAIALALRTRELHLIGLLSVLPLHVNRALGRLPDAELAAFSAFCLDRLPNRNIADMLQHPGLFLTDIFTLLQNDGELILAKAELYTDGAF